MREEMLQKLAAYYKGKKRAVSGNKFANDSTAPYTIAEVCKEFKTYDVAVKAVKKFVRDSDQKSQGARMRAAAIKQPPTLVEMLVAEKDDLETRLDEILDQLDEIVEEDKEAAELLAPKVEAPKVEAPKVEAPKVDLAAQAAEKLKELKNAS